MAKRTLLGRLGESVLIVFCIVTLNFFLIRFMPGDPVLHIIGEEEYYNLEVHAPQVIEEIRGEYGLNQSLGRQYLTYLGKTARLDFGNSYRTKAPVLETVLFRMKWTLFLAIPATVIAAFLGGALGLWAGWKPGGRFDLAATPCFLLISSVPTNCLAILFLICFAFQLGWFPISGITSGGLTGFAKGLDILHHMALPLAVLVLYKTSSNYMLMKSTVSLIRQEDYVSTAISKGLSQGKVLSRHVLKNALCPYLTSICMQFGGMLAGSMMTEIVFSWKGMGTLIYDAVNAKDFPMLQTCFLLISICVVAFNLIADLLCLAVDPRVREGMNHVG